MATLPITTSSTAAAKTVLETYRTVSSSASKSSLQNESTDRTPSSNDFVTLSKQAKAPRTISDGRLTTYSQNIFTSYADLLQQQQKAQAMIQQDLSASSDTAHAQASVLNRFQTLQYRQNSSQRVFNLKGDIFQNMFNIAV